MRTNLEGFRRNMAGKSWAGYWTLDGHSLSDFEAHIFVAEAIKAGYECDADVPEEKIKEWIGNSKGLSENDKKAVEVAKRFTAPADERVALADVNIKGGYAYASTGYIAAKIKLEEQRDLVVFENFPFDGLDKYLALWDSGAPAWTLDGEDIKKIASESKEMEDYRTRQRLNAHEEKEKPDIWKTIRCPCCSADIDLDSDGDVIEEDAAKEETKPERKSVRLSCGDAEEYFDCGYISRIFASAPGICLKIVPTSDGNGSSSKQKVFLAQTQDGSMRFVLMPILYSEELKTKSMPIVAYPA